MATVAITSALFQMMVDWGRLAGPILARDPAFYGRLGVSSMQGFRDRLIRLIEKFDDATAIAVVNNELSAATGAINQTFGTSLSAPQFQAPSVTPLSTSPPLTPEQVATFSTGVDLSALDPELVEAAAVLAPESVAAQFVAEQKAPISVQRGDPVPLGTPPAPPVGIPVVTRVPSVAAQVGVARTFAEVAAAAGSGPVIDPGLPLNTRNVMAITQEALFVSSETTSLPTAGGPVPIGIQARGIDPLFGIRLGGLGTLLGAAAGSLIGVPQLGAALGTALLSGGSSAGQQFVPPGLGRFPAVTVGQALPGFPQFQPTPGFTGLQQPRLPSPGFGPDIGVTQSVLDFLNQFPAFTPPGFAGRVGTGIQSFLQPSDTGQVSIPLNGATATTGMPIAPVLNATQSICYRAPKGYVVVEIVGSNGVPVKVAMWKPLARSMKLFKSRPKPPITASEMKSLRTADRVAKKTKRIASLAGFTCQVKGRARRRSSSGAHKH